MQIFIHWSKTIRWTQRDCPAAREKLADLCGIRVNWFVFSSTIAHPFGKAYMYCNRSIKIHAFFVHLDLNSIPLPTILLLLAWIWANHKLNPYPNIKSCESKDKTKPNSKCICWHLVDFSNKLFLDYLPKISNRIDLI